MTNTSTISYEFKNKIRTIKEATLVSLIKDAITNNTPTKNLLGKQPTHRHEVEVVYQHDFNNILINFDTSNREIYTESDAEFIETLFLNGYEDKLCDVESKINQMYLDELKNQTIIRLQNQSVVKTKELIRIKFMSNLNPKIVIRIMEIEI